MLPANARVMSPSPNICGQALEDAIQRTGKHCIYTLYVAAPIFEETKNFLRQIGALRENDVFAPWVNLRIDQNLEHREWFVEVEGVRVASAGC